MTQTLTLKKIMEVNHALKQLGLFRLPIGYQVAKNIRISNSIIKDFEAIRDEEVKKRAVLDDNGKPKLCLYSIATNKPLEGVTWKTGDKVPEGTMPGSMFPDEASHKEAEELIEKALNEEHEISWHAIDESKLEGIDVPGALIEVLFGTVVTDAATK